MMVKEYSVYMRIWDYLLETMEDFDIEIPDDYKETPDEYMKQLYIDIAEDDIIMIFVREGGRSVENSFEPENRLLPLKE